MLFSKNEEYTKAISTFTDGLDYVVDNPQLERAYYLQIAGAHEADGDVKKANKFKTNSEQIKID